MRRDKEPKPPLMISRRELARLMAVTERHLQSLEAKGVFRPLRLGASVRYVRAEVEATIRRLTDEGGK